MAPVSNGGRATNVLRFLAERYVDISRKGMRYAIGKILASVRARVMAEYLRERPGG